MTDSSPTPLLDDLSGRSSSATTPTSPSPRNLEETPSSSITQRRNSVSLHYTLHHTPPTPSSSSSISSSSPSLSEPLLFSSVPLSQSSLCTPRTTYRLVDLNSSSSGSTSSPRHIGHPFIHPARAAIINQQMQRLKQEDQSSMWYNSLWKVSHYLKYISTVLLIAAVVIGSVMWLSMRTELHYRTEDEHQQQAMRSSESIVFPADRTSSSFSSFSTSSSPSSSRTGLQHLRDATQEKLDETRMKMNDRLSHLSPSEMVHSSNPSASPSSPIPSLTEALGSKLSELSSASEWRAHEARLHRHFIHDKVEEQMRQADLKMQDRIKHVTDAIKDTGNWIASSLGGSSLASPSSQSSDEETKSGRSRDFVLEHPVQRAVDTINEEWVLSRDRQPHDSVSWKRVNDFILSEANRMGISAEAAREMILKEMEQMELLPNQHEPEVVSSPLQGFRSRLFSFLSSFLPHTMSKLQAKQHQIQDEIQHLKDEAKNKVDQGKQFIRDEISEIEAGIKRTADRVMERSRNLDDKVMEYVGDKVQTGLEGIKSSADGVMAKSQELDSKILGAIGDKEVELAEKVGRGVGKVTEAIHDAEAKVIEWKDELVSKEKQVEGKVKRTIERVEEKGKEEFNHFQDLLNTKMEQVKGIVRGVIKGSNEIESHDAEELKEKVHSFIIDEAQKMGIDRDKVKAMLMEEIAELEKHQESETGSSSTISLLASSLSSSLSNFHSRFSSFLSSLMTSSLSSTEPSSSSPPPPPSSSPDQVKSKVEPSPQEMIVRLKEEGKAKLTQVQDLIGSGEESVKSGIEKIEAIGTDIANRIKSQIRASNEQANTRFPSASSFLKVEERVKEGERAVKDGVKKAASEMMNAATNLDSKVNKLVGQKLESALHELEAWREAVKEEMKSLADRLMRMNQENDSKILGSIGDAEMKAASKIELGVERMKEKMEQTQHKIKEEINVVEEAIRQLCRKMEEEKSEWGKTIRYAFQQGQVKGTGVAEKLQMSTVKGDSRDSERGLQEPGDGKEDASRSGKVTTAEPVSMLSEEALFHPPVAPPFHKHETLPLVDDRGLDLEGFTPLHTDRGVLTAPETIATATNTEANTLKEQWRHIKRKVTEMVKMPVSM